MRLKIMPFIVSSLIVLTLPACLVSVKPGGGYNVILKPTQAQINAAAVKIVCGSFRPIYFSGRLDSPETIAAIRRHNAAIKAYGCKLASK